MPWTYRKLLSGELLAVSRLEEFPPKAAEERRYARLNGGACIIRTSFEAQDIERHLIVHFGFSQA
jgi:hypothetical protein